MTKDVENRVIAFVRSVAEDCAGCMRRAEANCRTCRAKFAQALMRDISVSTGKVVPIDYSLATRMHRIVSAIESANRPLTTSEIDLGGTCSFQLKYWTLTYMVRKGVLSRTVAFRRGKSRKKYYRYFLRKKKETTKNETHTNRDHESQAAESRPPRALRQGAHGDRRP